MSVTQEITIKHLVKYMRSKLKNGWHGTIMIKCEDGKIKFVTGQDTFNTGSFIDHCEKLPNRYVVRSNKDLGNRSGSKLDEKVTESERNATIGEELVNSEEELLSDE